MQVGLEGGSATARVADRYALLPAQAGMLFNNLSGPAGVDIIQIVIGCPEPVDRAACEQAWRRAVARHPVLRTAFAFPTGQDPVQQVYAGIDLRVEWHEVTGDTDAYLEPFLRADRARPVDISVPPVLRVSVLAAPEEHLTVVTFQHAILDGRSVQVLFAEVYADYDAVRAGGDPPAFPPRPPYRDFAVWWEKQDPTADRAFWADLLAGYAAPGPLPGQLCEPRSTAEPVSLELTLDEPAAAAVRAAATRAGVSVATMVNAAWALLLSRYRDTDDVVFAVTRSCRRGTADGAESMVGLLINSVPLRVRVPAGATVAELLAEAARQVAAVREHQVTPLGEIRRWAQLPTGATDTLVVFERQLIHTALTRVDPRFAGRTLTVHRQPSFPMTLYVFDEPAPRVTLIYDQCQFLPAAAGRILHHVRQALTALAGDPDTRLADLALADAEEQALVTREWNATAGPYPREATIGERFAAQAARTPDAVAVVSAGTQLSYAELDARANRLAHLLQEHGVGVDDRVAVALPRDAGLVVALLAVVKAGGAYVPLDPANPPARTALVLADSGARAVLTSGEFAAALPATGGVRVLALDALAADLARQPATAPPCPARATSLAYLSYTSGSTGVPKGVAVPHRAVLRLVHDPSFVSLGPGETLLQLAPVAFDASTLELWGSLLTGARLAVAPPGPLALPQLAAVLRDTGVTTLWLTSGLFHQVVELDVAALSGVRQLLAGGDVLAPAAVRAALRARGGQPVINGYGPTENTTFTACHRMTDPDEVADRVPIGRPIQQTTAYVLDGRMRPVPVGVPGELYTGGDGLARGYAGRPALTAERFVPDPFGARPGGRLYRTGDRARWRADGVLEFLGRADAQVKIRGFRVEPGEVEAVLRARPEVRDAVVVPRGDAEDRRLVAYLTTAEGTDRAAVVPALREYAGRQLPAYLVPAAFVVLDALPLNANGKVDRAALPDPEPAAAAAFGAAGHALPAEPRSPVEVRLAGIWGEILGVERVGRDDDFFARGGSSLAATRLVFRVRDAFGVDLPLLRLYQAPTLAGCAAAIDELAAAHTSPVGPAGSAGPAGSDDPAGPGGLASPADPVGPAAPAAGGITRRDRSAYRVGGAAAPQRAAPPVPQQAAAAQPAGAGLPAHLVPLATPRWALWRWICLRSAGFPFDLHDALASAELTAAADRLNAAEAARAGDVEELRQAYHRELALGERRLAHGLHEVAADPRFREAVAWQNRHALLTGVDALLRRDPQTVPRTGRYRKYEALVASYLQRYCAKNDTIGFYGPVGWTEIRDGTPAVELRPVPGGELARRTVYFEEWALRALAGQYATAARPWLAPRRMPFVDVSVTPEGCWLRVPFAPPVPVSPLEAQVFRLVDGVRSADEIAAAVLAGPQGGETDRDQVLRVLAELHAARRIAWTLDVAPDDIHAERTVWARLSRVADPAVREPALAALDELEAARGEVAAATGDAGAVVAALGRLDETFTRLTGDAPTRRAGEVYAGRTLVFEECLRPDDVTFGPGLLEPLREPLELVLEAARWFTAAGAALFHRACLEVYRERARVSGRAVVPFAEFWVDAGDLIFNVPDELARPLVKALQERWARVLALPRGVRRVDLASAALRDRVRKEFSVARPGWPAAVEHSPDLMLAARDAEAIRAGDFLGVLGELHPGVNTMRYATWVAYHPSPERMRAAVRNDFGRPVVVLAPTGEEGGTPARLSNVLVADDDTQLVFAHDSSGYDPRRALFVGECDLVETGGRLVVRRRDGGGDQDLVEVLADPLSLAFIQLFRVVPKAAYTPRVTIDQLVVQREAWTFPAGKLDFAGIVDEARRFLAARRWVTGSGLPRYVFARTAGEMKPIFVDLANLASVDLLARAVRRARRNRGEDAPVTISEMLPTPDQLWLSDAQGRRYTSELRICAVDRTGRT
ncbi:MAG TPA: amino acid adenylation domain-containing protein [Micromonosporaceae bacterium]|nr:amino acid adenylation domain-containing protein [Micromonosporaceae bacterium]